MSNSFDPDEISSYSSGCNRLAHGSKMTQVVIGGLRINTQNTVKHITRKYKRTEKKHREIHEITNDMARKYEIPIQYFYYTHFDWLDGRNRI